MKMQNTVKLRPSAAHRWATCPGSVALHAEDNAPDDARDAGSAMHMLAAELLSAKPPHPAVDGFVGRKFDVDGREVEITEEHAELVQQYVTAIEFYARGAIDQGCEVEVDVDHVTGEPGASGRVDYYVLTDGGAELQVHDLKTGHNPVSPEKNLQLALYASGLVRSLSLLFNIDRVRLVIHQPSIYKTPSEWSCSVADLAEICAGITYAAEIALAACDSIAFYYESLDSGLFNPGEEQCKYCSAKATCPALEKAVLDAILGVAESTAQRPLSEAVSEATRTTDERPADRLAEQYAALPLIDMFCKAVSARMYSLASTVGVPGYKLVEGRKGPRRWTSAEQAEAALKAMRYRRDDMYKMTVISPTRAEALIAKSNPTRWEKLQRFITRSDGRLQVVPESDKRQAATIGPVFDDLTGEEGNA